MGWPKGKGSECLSETNRRLETARGKDTLLPQLYDQPPGGYEIFRSHRRKMLSRSLGSNTPLNPSGYHVDEDLRIVRVVRCGF